MKLTFLTCLLLLGCPAPKPVPTDPLGRPTTCADVCEHLFKLGCGPAMDSTCLTTCSSVERSSLQSWNLDCFMHTTTCAEADECDGTR